MKMSFAKHESGARVAMLRKATAVWIAWALMIGGFWFSARSGPAQTRSRRPIVMVWPTRIGKSGNNFRNPTIAISPKTPLVAVVVESGPIGRRRLALAQVSGGWTNPSPIEVSGPGDCRNPSIAYDSTGTLHLVWSEKIGDAYAIRYATRSAGGTWKDEGLLSDTPGLDCDLPQLAIDRQGRIWAAWQAGVATRCGIYLARRKNPEPFSAPIDVTGPAGDHHNFCPQLFPGSLYPLVWYEEVGTGLELRAAVFDESDGTIDIVTPLDFDRLDANQQPRLFRAPSGMLGGVWTDLVGGRERVLVGFQGERTRGEGLVADASDVGDACYPSALGLGDNTVVLSWISRTARGTQVFVGRVDGESKVGPSVALAELADGTFTRPQILYDGLFVHCVWISDAARGGSGDLYYCALVFRP